MLDPREVLDQPILDSVHIPASEIEHRSFELPPKERVIQVIGGFPESEIASIALGKLGRAVSLCFEWEFGESEQGRLWEPNPLLELAGTPGATLDLGCGSGRDAVYLASLGWEVTAIDHLPDAIDLARTLESRYLGTQQVRWVIGDATSAPSDPYSLITSFRFLDRNALSQSLEFLVPGGIFMLEALSETHRRKTGSPKNRSWSANLDEFSNLFPEFEQILAEEGDREGKHTVRMIARKPIVTL